MALVVGISIGAVGLAVLSSYNARQEQMTLAQSHAQKQQVEADTVANTVQKHTGFYGSVEEITTLLSQPDVMYITAVREDTDLSGVPCRWLYMSNGGAYRTYDTTTVYPIGKLETQ